jgi:hypothetical protein
MIGTYRYNTEPFESVSVKGAISRMTRPAKGLGSIGSVWGLSGGMKGQCFSGAADNATQVQRRVLATQRRQFGQVKCSKTISGM